MKNLGIAFCLFLLFITNVPIIWAQSDVLYKENEPVYSIVVPEERFIDKIVYTKTEVIVYARFMSSGRITIYSSKGKHPWQMINSTNRKEKVLLTDVKNIKKNKVLLKKALGKEPEVTYENTEPTEYSCEIYFPALPQNFKVVDLIEGNETSRADLYVTYFDFKKLRLKTFPKQVDKPVDKPEVLEESTTTEESIAALETGQSLILKNILFNVSKSELLPESFVELNKLVQAMKKNQLMEIEISGHTDNVGKYPEEKKKLSLERAESVKKYLMQNGIDGMRLQTLGLGDSMQLNDNSTAELRKQNRRVEIKVLKK